MLDYNICLLKNLIKSTYNREDFTINLEYKEAKDLYSPKANEVYFFENQFTGTNFKFCLFGQFLSLKTKNILFTHIASEYSQNFRILVYKITFATDIMRMKKVTMYAYNTTSPALEWYHVVPQLLGEGPTKLTGDFYFFENSKEHIKIMIPDVFTPYVVKDTCLDNDKYVIV